MLRCLKAVVLFVLFFFASCALVPQAPPVEWQKIEGVMFGGEGYLVQLPDKSACYAEFLSEGSRLVLIGTSSPEKDPIYIQATFISDEGSAVRVKQVLYERRTPETLYGVSMVDVPATPENNVYGKICAGPSHSLPPEVQNAFRGNYGFGK